MTHPSNPNTDWRNQEIKIDPFVYQLAAGIFLIVIAILIGFALFPNDKGYLANIYTTLIGVLITVVYLDRRAERREALRAQSELKARLISELRSSVPELTKRALEQLNENGWLLDGSLRNQLLIAANLQEGILIAADLQETQLLRANLQDAKLVHAKLNQSILWGANFQQATMLGAELNGANLRCANLEGAWMQEASLKGTMLRDANLQNAHLDDVHFSDKTCLPDGTFWSPETDLTRFTDSNHPQFWRSDDPASPAYRGRLSSTP